MAGGCLALVDAYSKLMVARRRLIFNVGIYAVFILDIRDPLCAWPCADNDCRDFYAPSRRHPAANDISRAVLCCFYDNSRKIRKGPGLFFDFPSAFSYLGEFARRIRDGVGVFGYYCFYSPRLFIF